jgi:hypothetical protein
VIHRNVDLLPSRDQWHCFSGEFTIVIRATVKGDLLVAIARLTSETVTTATVSVAAPQQATVVEIVVFPGPAGGASGTARQTRTIVGPL